MVFGTTCCVKLKSLALRVHVLNHLYMYICHYNYCHYHYYHYYQNHYDDNTRIVHGLMLYVCVTKEMSSEGER